MPKSAIHTSNVYQKLVTYILLHKITYRNKCYLFDTLLTNWNQKKCIHQRHDCAKKLSYLSTFDFYECQHKTKCAALKIASNIILQYSKTKGK